MLITFPSPTSALTKVKDFRFTVPQFLSKKEKLALNQFVEQLFGAEVQAAALVADEQQKQLIEQYYKTAQ